MENFKQPVNEIVIAGEFWKKKIDNLPENIIQLRDINADNELRVSEIKHLFDPELNNKILKMCKNNDLSILVYLTAALKVYLYKISGELKQAITSPVYKEENREVNDLLFFLYTIKSEDTFKDLLIKVKSTIIESYKFERYPIEQLMSFEEGGGKLQFPNIGISMQNIHGNISWADFSDFDLIFNFSRNENELELTLKYNSSSYFTDTIKKIIQVFEYVLKIISSDINIDINKIEIATGEEQKIIQNEFNSNLFLDGGKTLSEIFEEQVQKFPERNALTMYLDLDEVYRSIQANNFDEETLDRTRTLCIDKSKYLFEKDLTIKGSKYKFLKTSSHNSLLINLNLYKLIGLFNGKDNLNTIYENVKLYNIHLEACSYEVDDILEVVSKEGESIDITLNNSYNDLVTVTSYLIRQEVIKIETVKDSVLNHNPKCENKWDSKALESEKLENNILFSNRDDIAESEVLILGDTNGMPSVGLLYLASYLEKKGHTSYCQFYDSNFDFDSMKNNLEKLISKIKPKIVSVSMKWFAYTARVLEICKIVREISDKYKFGLKIVVGGNTASFYYKEVIENDTIDFIIRGDGELPLLQICEGNKNPDNSVYKKWGETIINPITYVQGKDNSDEIYLSSLDKTLLSPYTSLLGTFFIYTHKGCPMKCLYCAGCQNIQQKSFNRTVHYRDIEEVRKDMIETKPYTSTYMFDFVSTNEQLLEYYQNIWKGIDLSSHFCIFVNVFTPSKEIVELVNNTFLYVYWDLDIASMSERHRLELSGLKEIKRQPTDNEVYEFMQNCDSYNNNEVRINTINGMPLFIEEDIKRSQEFISNLKSRFNVLSSIHWARLHAQPGTAISENPEKYNMHSHANTYDDFLDYSYRNFETIGSQDFSKIEYPFVYFDDDKLNSFASKLYSIINTEIEEFNKKEKVKPLSIDVSYAQLNSLVSELSNRILNHTKGENCLVGILMDASIEVVVSILSILKAGCTYLPISPDLPIERVDYMLKDSGPELLIINRKITKSKINLAENKGIKLLVAEDICENQVQYNNNISAELPAYIIYTSGSSGNPKAVIVPNKGVVNYTQWRIKKYNLTSTDTTLQLLSYTFDGFNSNFYSSLLSGGSLFLIPDSRKLDIDFIRRIIKDKQVTNTSLIPWLYKSVIDVDDCTALKSLRFVVLAGEKATKDLVDRSRKLLKETLLVNEYGPTEASVTVLANIGMIPENVSIVGEPIDNTLVHILAPKGKNTLPIGLFGELCVEGKGIAVGYLNNADLTNQVFRTEQNTGRLYRTGDIARWLPQGRIELKGRIDNQIKIRGYRVELGEIENAIKNIDEIKDIIIVVGSSNEKDLYLTSYFTSDRILNINEIRGKLKNKLPDYMIPSFFVQLEKLPRNINGKVNKEELPNPKNSVVRDKEFVEPESIVEIMVTDIWKRVLGINEISILDNFFDLGGNSQDIIKLRYELDNVMDKKIKVSDLFRYTNVLELSKFYVNSSIKEENVFFDKSEDDKVLNRKLTRRNRKVH